MGEQNRVKMEESSSSKEKRGSESHLVVGARKIKEEVKKINWFCQTWKVVDQIKVSELGDRYKNMEAFIVVSFSPAKQEHLNYQSELPQNLENNYLIKILRRVQQLLLGLFFRILVPSPAFLLSMVENLISQCTIALETIFHSHKEPDEFLPLRFELHQECQEEGAREKAQFFLQNARVIGAILANLLRNQLKIIVNTRVVYDREAFNYDQYISQGVNDGRLLTSALFINDGKKLIAEFLQFQSTQRLDFFNNFDLMSYSQIANYLSSLTIHLDLLYDLQTRDIDVEGILLVYFSKLCIKNIPKDALSKVSKSFFKFFKLQYITESNKQSSYELLQFDTLKDSYKFVNQLDNWEKPRKKREGRSLDLFQCWQSLYWLFQGTQDVNLQSFFQFNSVNLCAQIAEEHMKLAGHIMSDNNFPWNNSLQKFCLEIQKMNAVIHLLFHLDFRYNRYYGFKVLRDVQMQVKKFCEISERKIEKAERILKLRANL